MFQPKDINNIPDEEWEDFKKEALKDELFYNGPGDLLDTPEVYDFLMTEWTFFHMMQNLFDILMKGMDF